MLKSNTRRGDTIELHRLFIATSVRSVVFRQQEIGMIASLTQFVTPKSTNYYGISNSKLTRVWTTTSQILCF